MNSWSSFHSIHIKCTFKENVQSLDRWSLVRDVTEGNPPHVHNWLDEASYQFFFQCLNRALFLSSSSSFLNKCACLHVVLEHINTYVCGGQRLMLDVILTLCSH